MRSLMRVGVLLIACSHLAAQGNQNNLSSSPRPVLFPNASMITPPNQAHARVWSAIQCLREAGKHMTAGWPPGLVDSMCDLLEEKLENGELWLDNLHGKEASTEPNGEVPGAFYMDGDDTGNHIILDNGALDKYPNDPDLSCAMLGLALFHEALHCIEESTIPLGGGGSSGTHHATHALIYWVQLGVADAFTEYWLTKGGVPLRRALEFVGIKNVLVNKKDEFLKKAMGN